MDKHFLDGSAVTTGLYIFWNWLMGNMEILQNALGLMVGVSTLVYTLIRIYQVLRKGK